MKYARTRATHPLIMFIIIIGVIANVISRAPFCLLIKLLIYHFKYLFFIFRLFSILLLAEALFFYYSMPLSSTKVIMLILKVIIWLARQCLKLHNTSRLQPTINKLHSALQTFFLHYPKLISIYLLLIYLNKILFHIFL